MDVRPLKLGRKVSYFGHPVYLVMPEQQEEVLQEIMLLNDVLPAVNTLLPETATGSVPLLRISPEAINFEETDDAPDGVMNYTHFRNAPERPDGQPARFTQTLFFRSRDGQDDPLSRKFELDVSGMMLMNPENQIDIVLLALHVLDTLTFCRFRRSDNGLVLDRARHRDEGGRYTRVCNGPGRVRSEAADTQDAQQAEKQLETEG